MSTLDHESIANETKLHQIARIIDNEFFTESIKEQIYSGLESTTTDYLKEFNIKFTHVVNNFNEVEYANVIQYRDELNSNIIDWISDKYDVELTYDDDELVSIVKQLYRFFVVDLKRAVQSFLVSYILENYTTMINALEDNQLNLRYLNSDIPKEEQYPIIVASNIGTMVDRAIDEDVGYDEFIRYAAMAGDITSVSELNSGHHVLSIADGSGMFRSVMTDLKENTFDHSLIISVSELILSALDINKGDVSDNE